uniref:C-type lectin domain-containing protein n=1 Tax=Acrobeloides nanus TaxID=290746 RepID=A0A914DXV1_9BILA
MIFIFIIFLSLFIQPHDTATLECPKGWIEGPFLKTCYKYIAYPLTWFQAEFNCISYGGHLASVSNGFLNAFLLGAAEEADSGSYYWIGGTGVYLPSNNFTWSDASPFSYQAWGPSQPGPDQFITQQTPGGQWYTFPYTTPLAYICEILQGSGGCQTIPPTIASQTTEAAEAEPTSSFP